VTTGFEPVNAGFADPCVKPLRHVTLNGSPSGNRNSGVSPAAQEKRRQLYGWNSGLADHRPRPLGYVAQDRGGLTHRSKLAAPRGFEPRLTDPKSAVLPLDEGAIGTRPSLRGATRGSGAEDGTRTRDPHLGKVMLYQLSYFRPVPRAASRRLIWCREPDSNWRHRDFQSRALPTELSRPAGAVEILDHI
jgi:hypothetical protein